MPAAPALRLQVLNDAPVNPRGEYVLYWMIANRRTTWNFSLDEAVSWAEKLNKPLLVLEALRAGYPWASDRLHKFIIDGMADNAESFANSGVAYYPYLERKPGEGKGLLSALARKACLVVTDHFPDFFLPRMVAAAAQKIPVRLIQVDSNGLHSFEGRRSLLPHGLRFSPFYPEEHRRAFNRFSSGRSFFESPVAGFKDVPSSVIQKWTKAPAAALKGSASFLAGLRSTTESKPSMSRGGSRAARSQWKRFLERGFAHYLEFRNEPEAEGTSGLSPYLHFGHISTHQIFKELMDQEGWSLPRLPEKTTGRRGWWGVSEGAEMFLDQLITWRELGYNMCARREDYDRYESLPLWAQKTLSDHAHDRRPYKYIAGAIRVWKNSRSPLERRPDAACPGRPLAQLSADALGEKNPGMVWQPPRSPADHDRAEQQIRPGWPGPQLLQRDLLGPRAVRSPLGAGTAHFRKDPIPELRKYRPQDSSEEFHQEILPGMKESSVRVKKQVKGEED